MAAVKWTSSSFPMIFCADGVAMMMLFSFVFPGLRDSAAALDRVRCWRVRVCLLVVYGSHQMGLGTMDRGAEAPHFCVVPVTTGFIEDVMNQKRGVLEG